MQLPKDEDTYYIVKNGKDNKYYDLLYKRGYLISEQEYEVKPYWKNLKIGGGRYYVTFDPLNDYAYIEDGTDWVFILGTAMDTLAWHMDLNKIAKNILNNWKKSKEAFYDYIDYLNGRHIIFWGNETEARLLQDATGMRSAYYNKTNRMIASHYNLINDFIHEERHPFMKKYLQMTPTPWILPGNITPVKNVFVLTPNHEIALPEMTIHRFWPRKDHDNLSVNEVMDYIANCIYNEVKVLNERHNLMFQLTKGNDSRITLSACKDIIGKQYPLFYSYIADQDPAILEDAQFTRKLADSFFLNYKQIDIRNLSCSEVDFEEIKSIAFVNHYHHHLFWTIPEYFKELPQNFLTVRSNLIEIIRYDMYGGFPNQSTPDDVVAMFYSRYRDEPDVRDICEKYYKEFEYDKLYNYIGPDFLFGENRLGIWLNNGVLLKDDLNFDTFMLFNQRKIFEKGLSVPRYYRKSNFVVYETIRRLWPEMLYYLPNTDYTLNDYYIPDGPGIVDFVTPQITSGSTENAERHVPAYAHTGRYAAELGFGQNAVKKNDFVQWKVDIPIKQTGTFDLQITLFAPAKWRLEKFYSDVVIKINDEKVYQENLNSFCNKDNQINIIQTFAKDDTVHCAVELVANEDHTSFRGIPGFIFVRSVVCSPCTVKLDGNERRRVFSTAEMMKNLCD